MSYKLLWIHGSQGLPKSGFSSVGKLNFRDIFAGKKRTSLFTKTHIQAHARCHAQTPLRERGHAVRRRGGQKEKRADTAAPTDEEVARAIGKSRWSVMPQQHAPGGEGGRVPGQHVETHSAQDRHCFCGCAASFNYSPIAVSLMLPSCCPEQIKSPVL